MMKKFFVMLLILVLCVGLAVVASASEDKPIPFSVVVNYVADTTVPAPGFSTALSHTVYVYDENNNNITDSFMDAIRVTIPDNLVGITLNQAASPNNNQFTIVVQDTCPGYENITLIAGVEDSDNPGTLLVQEEYTFAIKPSTITYPVFVYDVLGNYTVVTSANKDNVLGDSGTPSVVYTPAVGTEGQDGYQPQKITLTNASFGGLTFTNSDDAQVVLVGDSTVTPGQQGSSCTHAIAANGDGQSLKISGMGSLTMVGGQSDCIQGGDNLTISSAKITMKSSTAESPTLSVSNGDIVITDGAVVEVTAGDTNAVYARSGNLSVLNGAKLTASNTSNTYPAIYADGTVAIDASNLTASSTGYGAFGAYGKLSINNGAIVKVEGGTTTASVIWSNTAMSIDDAKLEAENTAGSSVISSWGTMSASNGVEIIASNYTGSLDAIVSQNDLSISDSTFRVTANASGNGIATNGNFTISGNSDVNISCTQVAVYAGKSVIISENAQLTAAGQWAIWSGTNAINISGGTVEAIGSDYAIVSKPDLSGYVNPVVLAGTSEASAEPVTNLDGTDYHNTSNYVRIQPGILITFNPNGGTLNGAAAVVADTNGRLSALPADPTYAGYTFLGWFDAQTGGNQISINTVFTQSTTVYAQWEAATYTVTFVDHDGTVLKTETVEEGTAATAPADPTREGYTFTGWDVAFDSITADITVTAQYAINTYTVTFDSNGGSGTMAPQTFTEGVEQNLTLNTFTREGFTFIGWNTAADGSGVSFADGASITASGNATLYAQWQKNAATVYTVTVSNDGNGTGTAIPSSGATGTEVTLTAMPNSGYRFKEWQVINGGVTVTDNKLIIGTANVEVKAIFELIPAVTYTVTFDPNGGTGTMTPQMFTAGVAQALSPNLFTREGFTFEGWNIAADGSGIAFADGATITASSDAIMYAQWEAVPAMTPLTITKQPTDQFVVEGQRAEFSVEATGDGLTYQWYINRNDGRGWRVLDDAVGAAYVTSVADLECDGFQYGCLITDQYGNTLKSDVAVLHVSKVPVLPETGDSSTPMLWLAMSILSMAGILLLRKKAYSR